MTVDKLYLALLHEVAGFFQPQADKPEETPETVLRALWFAAAGRPRSPASLNGSRLPAMDPAGIETLKDYIARKRDGIPLAHITGRQGFLGIELLCGPAALIPRKETEILGRAAIAFLRQRARRGRQLRALDVCTGCGNLALAFAAHEPATCVLASDVSARAIALARRNAAYTGLAARVRFRTGDLFAPFEGDAELLGNCDLVSCNPPYISSAKVPRMGHEIVRHEPRLAFDGGAMGIGILARLVNEAPRFLRPGGALCFELGAGQGPILEGRLRRQRWVEAVEAHRDRNGVVRALVATRKR